MIRLSRTFYLKQLLFFYLFFNPLCGFSQDISIKNTKEHIIVEKDTSFLRHVSITLKENDKVISYPIFYDSELEKISDIKVYTKKGKKFKQVTNPLVKEDNVNLDYIASKKIKSVYIPAASESKISYSVQCKELMYLSSLPFFSNNKIDTLSYEITIPNTFHLLHNTVYSDSLNYISLDSIDSNNTKTWNISLIPKKIEPDPLSLFGIYKNKYYPLMRTIVVPVKYKDNEIDYMNDWYFKEVKTKRGLDFNAIAKIEELTEGISDPSQIVNILYDYVRNNFKYVAIEVGMGAFIPSHTNEVFINKEGDCKDLSNFLSEALNYKGIRSDIALASTYDHITDCDFPSLSSANHVICLAYLENTPILLDPTDPIHIPETPVQSIQNRSILIVNPEGGTWHKVKSFTPQQNLINYNIKLNENENGNDINGQFNTTYNGISGNFIRREFRYKSDSKIKSIGNKYYKAVFKDQSISNFEVLNQYKKVNVKGDLYVTGKIFNDVNNRILFIDFLPGLIENDVRDKLLEGTHLGSNFSKKVNLQIKLNKSFKTYQPIEYNFSEEGFSLDVKITNPTDTLVEISYEFICLNPLIEKKNHKAINSILKSFKKIINEPIILEEKE